MVATLTRCASCHNDVSSTAAACPRCGSTELESRGTPAVSRPLPQASPPFVTPWVPTRGFWIACTAIAAAIVLLVASSAILRATVYSPRAAINRYFAALAARDPAAVAKAQEDPDSTAMAAGLLRSPDYHPPQDLRIKKISVESGDRGGVADISYTIDGRPFSSMIGVEQSDQRAFATFDQWKVSHAAGALEVTGSTSVMAINGQHLPTDAPVLHPGSYRVSAADNPLVTVAPITVAVPVAGAGTGTLEPKLKPDAQKSFAPVIKTYVDGCVSKLAGGESVSEECPFLNGVYGSDVTVDSYPTTELAVHDGTITVTTTEPGQLTTGSGWGDSTAQSFELSGRADIDSSDRPVFTPDN